MFDEDPGVMSEVETSATGFRRSSRARSSLPIVRTPYKTQDRSLGLVFLQYRNETKRALLPNEITTIDTVRALFVRSFPRQLTMDYLESRNVRIYIHDPSKNMFYELEDLKDVRDRSVLRIYEQDSSNGAWLPVGSVKPMISSQFTLPNQHFNQPQQPHSQPPNVPKHAPPKPQRSFQALTLASSPSPRPMPPQGVYSGPLRLAASPGAVLTSANMQQPVMQPGTGGPAIQNTAIRGSIQQFNAYSNRPLPERPYSVAGHYPTVDNRRSHPDFSGYLSSPERRFINGEAIVPPSPRTSLPPHGFNVSHDDIYGTYGTRSASVGPIVDEEARIRVEYMEKQLANLTGLVKKALTTNQQPKPPTDIRGSDKNSGPHKPPPPPKPLSLSTKGSIDGSGSVAGKNISLSNDTYNHLKQLKKQTKDLRNELRNIRRMAQNQTIIAREMLCDASAKTKASLSLITPSDQLEKSLRFNRLRVSRDEEMYRIDVGRLEKDLNELESQVEGLRNNVINRRCRVNMSDVEAMALVLSRASKTVADLKTRFPHLQDALRTIMSHEKDILIREEE